MKISKILSAACALVVAAMMGSCGGEKFEINGNITNAKDSVLYLENLALDGIHAIDSVVLGEDGQFSFAQNATDAPELYRLRIAGQIINLSVDSTEVIGVKAEYPSMAYKYEVSGSDDCVKIQELALKQMQLQGKINNLVKDIQTADTTRWRLLDEMVSAYKEDVKMNYIYKEPNRTYSYFALFQTVVFGGRYNLIFNPRTNEDDVRVYRAVATSWDAFHPGSLRGENLHNIAIAGTKDMRIVKAQQEAQTLEIPEEMIDQTGIIDIVLRDNKDQVRRLSELKGKVVLLDFCTLSAPGTTERIMLMRELYNKYHAQGLEIFQVSFDVEDHFWKTQSAALPWVSVREPAGLESELVMTYNLMNIPTFFLVGRDNSIQLRDSQIDDLDKAIQKLL